MDASQQLTECGKVPAAQARHHIKVQTGGLHSQAAEHIRERDYGLAVACTKCRYNWVC